MAYRIPTDKVLIKTVAHDVTEFNIKIGLKNIATTALETNINNTAATELIQNSNIGIVCDYPIYNDSQITAPTDKTAFNLKLTLKQLEQSSGSLISLKYKNKTYDQSNNIRLYLYQTGTNNNFYKNTYETYNELLSGSNSIIFFIKSNDNYLFPLSSYHNNNYMGSDTFKIIMYNNVYDITPNIDTGNMFNITCTKDGGFVFTTTSTNDIQGILQWTNVMGNNIPYSIPFRLNATSN